MRVVAVYFLNPSSGEMAVSVRIADLKEAIVYQAKPAELDYTSVAVVKRILR